MVIKLKEGCLVELNNIKVAKVVQTFGDTYNVEISYFDDKKNSKEYIYCETEDEGNKLVDKLMSEIESSKKIKFY